MTMIDSSFTFLYLLLSEAKPSELIVCALMKINRF